VSSNKKDIINNHHVKEGQKLKFTEINGFSPEEAYYQYPYHYPQFDVNCI